MNVGGGCITDALPETVGLPAEYFLVRGIFLDCQGPVEIDASSIWGYRVMVLTRSHDVSDGKIGAVVPKPVAVERGAWIGSGAILYNCRIREGAIVAAGAVVEASVPPGCVYRRNGYTSPQRPPDWRERRMAWVS